MNPVETEKRAVPACAGCGARLPGGSDGCRAVYEELLAREYNDAAYGAVHLLSVDAYALQHPEECAPRSRAFHLSRLCWLIEQGGDARLGQSGPRWLQALFEGTAKAAVPPLAPPADRGAVTVADVYGTASPQEHAKRVQGWARAVWDAWSEHHEWARAAVRQLQNP